MNEGELVEVLELLRRPSAFAMADGLQIVVTAVRLEPDEFEQDGLVIDYQVPGLPSGVCYQPTPGPWHEGDLTTYAHEVAQELQAWAVEHVRKFLPPELPDRVDVAAALPSQAELWELLRQQFTDATDVPGGFAGTLDNAPVQVIITPAQWHELVISTEIGCRIDHGVDANRAGDGPAVALEDVAELAATLDRDEAFLVWAEGRIHRSTRAALPPVRGTALLRDFERFTREGGATWHP